MNEFKPCFLAWAGGVGSGRGSSISSSGGEPDGVSSGLLKLREDVLACGYDDVQVMWKMLHGSSPSEKATVEEVGSHPAELSSPHTPKAISGAWSAFFWSIHRTCSPLNKTFTHINGTWPGMVMGKLGFYLVLLLVFSFQRWNNPGLSLALVWYINIKDQSRGMNGRTNK